MLMGYEDQHKICTYQVSFLDDAQQKLKALVQNEIGKTSQTTTPARSAPSNEEEKSLAYWNLEVDKVRPRSHEFIQLCQDYVGQGQYLPDAVKVTAASVTTFIFQSLMKSVHAKATTTMLSNRIDEHRHLLALHQKCLELEQVEAKAKETKNRKM